jgi:hypothetical protein
MCCGHVKLWPQHIIQKARREELRIERRAGGIGILDIRLVDPDAPVEGGYYWVRSLVDTDPWEPAEFGPNGWFLPGAGEWRAQVAEIGPRIEPPAEPAPSSESNAADDPYAGRRRLQDGVTCRCPNGYIAPDSSFWCCQPAPELQSNAIGAVEPSRTLADAVRAARGGEAPIAKRGFA